MSIDPPRPRRDRFELESKYPIQQTLVLRASDFQTKSPNIVPAEANTHLAVLIHLAQDQHLPAKRGHKAQYNTHAQQRHPSFPFSVDNSAQDTS